MSETEQHSWPRVFGIFATGVTAAFLVGKAPAALPVPEAGVAVAVREGRASS